MGKKNRIKENRRSTRDKYVKNSESARTYVSSEPNDLFDNPMVKAAQAALSDEDKEKFRKLGESMFSGINFEDSQTLNNMPPPMAEAVAYLNSQIQAGMHPSMLNDNEKAILADAYGEEWYTDWGYVKEDLDDIVTLTPVSKNKYYD